MVRLSILRVILTLAVSFCPVGSLAKGTELGHKYRRHNIRRHVLSEEELLQLEQGEVQQESRIVGGTEMSRSSHPFLALIFYDIGDPLYFVCSGVLIAPDIVLTAAHCLEYADVIQIGRHDLDDKEENYEQVDIKEMLAHPDFELETYSNDYALLKLSKQSNATTLQLNNDTSTPQVGDPLTVMGWGAEYSGGWNSLVPQQTLVYYISNSDCSEFYRDLNGGNYNVPEYMLCAAAPGQDACQGDSGGPLIRKDNATNATTVVGLVSWGFGCADANFPGVYARISSAYDWIIEEGCKLSETDILCV